MVVAKGNHLMYGLSMATAKNKKPKVATANKVYVVGEVGWEYNDEYLYTGEYSGSHPQKVFTSKAAANKFALKKAIAAVGEISNLCEYDQFSRQSGSYGLNNNETVTHLKLALLLWLSSTANIVHPGDGEKYEVPLTVESWIKDHRGQMPSEHEIASVSDQFYYNVALGFGVENLYTVIEVEIE